MESTMAVEKSTHKVEVLEVKELIKHENADTLSKVKIYDYTCVVRTSDWKPGTLAAWVPPDSLVDTKRPEFAFLARKAKADGIARIRTEKLRGIVSYGLLVPAPEGMKVGDDAAQVLGVEHYDPEVAEIITAKTGTKLKFTGGEVAKPPRGTYPKYDVDAFLARGRLAFKEGELVAVTEKIHGCFGQDTEVKMGDGKTQRISQIQIGDSVKSFDLENNRFVDDKVTCILKQFNNPNIKWLELEFDNGLKCKCTEDHKFLTRNRNWVKASDLLESDDLVGLEE